jgi:cysteine-rich repeat protein
MHEYIHAGNTQVEYMSFTCLGGTSGTRSYRKQLPNIVSRKFIWSPVDWFPPFKFQYFAKENDKTSVQETCKVSVYVQVCQRPKFVMTQDWPVFGLASAPLSLKVTAEDLNEDDIVSVEVSKDLRGVVQVGDEEYDTIIDVDGLIKVRKNKVSRSLTVVMPSPADRVAEACFRARDNAYACDVDGLAGEDEMCVVCTLEASQVTAACFMEIRSTPLYMREHVPVCGDSRISGNEECDDGNFASGDGCSSTCTLELGYELQGNDPMPKPICGDGLAVYGEGCDDKNSDSSDGCDGCGVQVLCFIFSTVCV